ncbi:Uu.00g006140.m01.CDS01 [Anthostomella pinea]|uniref:Uu.00g006140.m01.CDS01 n=1 Tax=Anthostomella pinea TaxID=933095 RepID=A0AAI8VKA7_9PEZI|nr:Uu.00g006140.m01.CDS01 [Anthostomella pinea]
MMPSSIALRPTLTPFKQFYANQFGTKPQPPPRGTTFASKTAIITGSSSGIGQECARQMLDLNLSHLIMAVRNPAKGEAIAKELRKGHPMAVVDVWKLDMLHYASIQAFAEKCERELRRLDIVILNAGGSNQAFKVNKETGHEESLQLNYLSNALLGTLLLPVLKNKRSPGAGPGRMLFVSSALGVTSKFSNVAADPLLPSFTEPYVSGKEQWNLGAAQERYSMTKTLVNMFIYKLSTLVSADDVIIDGVEPGYTKGSGLDADVTGVLKWVLWVVKSLVARTLEHAAWTYIDAVDTKGKESHGCFLMCYRNWPFHALMYTPEGEAATERLWKETMDELDFAGVRGIVESMKH